MLAPEISAINATVNKIDLVFLFMELASENVADTSFKIKYIPIHSISQPFSIRSRHFL